MNKKNVRVLNFSELLPNIDILSKPVHYCSGADLRKMYVNTRSKFTITYSKGSWSGQNDPKIFGSYCLKLHASSELNVAGKQCLMMFRTYQCGTAHEVPADLQIESGCERTNRFAHENKAKRKWYLHDVSDHLSIMQEQVTKLTTKTERQSRNAI